MQVTAVKENRPPIQVGDVMTMLNGEAVAQMAFKDIAKAIKWVHDHAEEYGGTPDTILVAGDSAGAHLAALVCTDERYLEAEGLPLSTIKGCIPVDVGVYDIPTQFERDKAAGRSRAGARASAQQAAPRARRRCAAAAPTGTATARTSARAPLLAPPRAAPARELRRIPAAPRAPLLCRARARRARAGGSVR